MRTPQINIPRASKSTHHTRASRYALSLFVMLSVATVFAFSSTSSAKLINRLLTDKSQPALKTTQSTSARAAAHARHFKPGALPAAEASASSLASVTTDKTDYSPGETVAITGSGWLSGETVLLTLHQEPNVHGDTFLSAVADEYGNILNKDCAPNEGDIGTTYTVTANGQSSGLSATVTFTDGGIFSYSPNTTTLTIQTGPAPASSNFVQTMIAPGGNNSFQATPLVSSVPATTPLPAAWLSFSPNSRNFSTGPPQNPSADSKSWTVTATVPANTVPGTYVANLKASPSNPSVGVGQGTTLTLVVLPPAPVDNTPPSTSLSAALPNTNPYNGVNFTNANKVTITLSAVDPGSPSSGVAQTFYKIDNAATKVYNGPFDIAAEGVSVVTYFSTDAAGNQETPAQSFTVKIDKTAPTINAQRDTAANSFGWNNTDVQVSYTANDALSGINASASDATPYLLTSEGAGQSHTFTVYDHAGNSVTATVSNINIDKTAPLVSAARTPAPNSYGWNNGDVTVSIASASDALSGIDTQSSPVTVSTEGAGQSVTMTATDKAGNTASDTINDINIDKTAPTLNAARTPAANANGWNNTDVTATATASDALSGIDQSASTLADVLFSMEAAGQTTTFTAIDMAGNSATQTISDVNIDKTAPVINAQRDTAANANGWNNTNVDSSYAASDALSGLDGDSPANGSYTFTTEGAGQSHTFNVTDLAGNSASDTVSSVNIDKTAPTINSSRTPAANANGWNNTDVVASYTASDALSGLDGGSPASDSYTFNTEGAGQSHAFSVTDLAGNTASSTVAPVNIDKTAPTISASRTPAANSFGWNNTDVTANYNAGDGLSGLDAGSPATGSFVFNTEGAGQSHVFSVTDQAGNSNSATVSGVNLDKTAPAINITTPANNGSYVFNQVVAANFSETDALSGLNPATLSSTVPSGSNINTASVGSKSFTVSVTDKAGNTATKTANYSVLYAPIGAVCPSGPGRTILQPINADGTSVFKQGSTVPAKFRVYDANCNSIGTPGVVADFRLIQTINGTLTSSVNETVISTAADPAFRWSASDQQWIFNVNTKNLAANVTYIYRVTLNDGSTIDFRYGLK